MSRENSSRDGYPVNWTRSCDTCQAAACTLYCHTDSAYLCNRCDECIHSTDSVQHERVWVCTVCENAPAALFCQADAAFLCVNCDVEVHSANPLARRHSRMLIPPLSRVDCASSTCDPEEMRGPAVESENQITACKSNEEVQADETDSWLLLDLDSNDNLTDNGFTFVTDEAEEYLDLSEFSSCKEYQSQDPNDQQKLSSSYQVDNNSDSVVPIQSSEVSDQLQKQQQQNICYSEDSETSKVASSAAKCGQTVTVPFVNAGFLVKATSDIVNSRPAIPRGSNYLFPQPLLPMPLQFTPTNRQARVLRYREKRKARTFQKKIRYASRKANAESRPRVKGRFARKTDREFEEDQMIATEDYGYGIVPSY